jgi:hypothetical protein
MRTIQLTFILLFTISTCGQNKLYGIYSDRFGEKIELKLDSSFLHSYRFDLASSWTIGKWKVSNDTIYLKTEFVSDSLKLYDSDGKLIKDSLVLSADQKVGRVQLSDLLVSILSAGGQNRVKPPNQLYWKRNRLYRIKKNGKLDLRKLKAFWTDKKHKTYFRKETE